METGIVNLHGKDYSTVALRIKNFWSDHPDYGIESEILSIDEKKVLVKATIKNPAGVVVAAGHAEEDRKGNINSKSALENCETSAWGRALACLGYGGTNIASAEEMINKDSGDYIDDDMADEIDRLLTESGADMEKFLKYLGADALITIKKSDFNKAISALKKKLKGGK